MNDLSMHILDIVQNSISANASLITLEVVENTKDDVLSIAIIDNGKGMTSEQVALLDDPFFTTRTTRKVGLGVPLLKQTAQQSGGSLKIESEVGKGTTLFATFGLNNIDRPPMGDLANAVVLLLSANPDIKFIFRYEFDGEEYVLDTDEVNEALDGMSVNNPSIVLFLTDMVRNNINLLKSE